jgi:hypothetical protein
MKRIIFLMAVIFLISCQEVKKSETETEQQVIEQQEVINEPKEIPFIPVDPNRASLEFLRNLEGEYPFKSDLFKSEPMKGRLEKLLAHKYMDFIQRMEVQMPVEIQDDLAIMRGLMTHGSGTEEAILVVDIPKNLMWLAILQNGDTVIHLNEDGNLKMPIPLFQTIFAWKS